MSDIDTVMVDSLKVLDPERPIREADMLIGNIWLNVFARGLGLIACAGLIGLFGLGNGKSRGL